MHGRCRTRDASIVLAQLTSHTALPFFPAVCARCTVQASQQREERLNDQVDDLRDGMRKIQSELKETQQELKESRDEAERVRRQ